jgi:hypothetical protein
MVVFKDVLARSLMRRNLYLYSFVLLTLIYICLALLLPSDPATLQKYNITQARAHLISLSVVLPLVSVWCSALYGFLRFKSYAMLVKDSEEGPSFNRLADGLMVLAFSLPVGGIIGSLLNFIAVRSTDLAPTATILRNYIALVFSLVAFMLIAKGAKGLALTLRSKAVLQYPRYSAIALIVLSSVFTWLIVTRPSSELSSDSIYFLPNWLIILTLAIPYLFIWYKGTLAAYRLRLYKDKLKSRIYKQAFGDLATGIWVIVGLSIFLQLLTTFNARLSRLDLTPLLLLVYLLIVFYALGYGLVARGAKKLKKIEEV